MHCVNTLKIPDLDIRPDHGEQTYQLVRAVRK